MTREEAKNQFSNELLERVMGFKKGKLKIGAVYKIIDDIYDNLESRTCENCDRFNDYNCSIYEGISLKNNIDKTFGCNKFERIKNETNNK